MTMRGLLLILPCAAALALGACEGTKEALGLESSPPDEFAVVKRAPLELPPDYYLRPPSPGAQRPQELKTDEQARQTVFGDESVVRQEPQERSLSSGESILLQKSNAVNVDPDIRAKVDAETAEIAKEEQPTIDKLRGVVGKKVDAPASVVDPVKETERLKQNALEGKPVTEGATPTIKK
jgi:hypothetical protein